MIAVPDSGNIVGVARFVPERESPACVVGDAQCVAIDSRAAVVDELVAGDADGLNLLPRNRPGGSWHQADGDLGHLWLVIAVRKDGAINRVEGVRVDGGSGEMRWTMRT